MKKAKMDDELLIDTKEAEERDGGLSFCDARRDLRLVGTVAR
jgi:hypothetical protein